MTVLAVETELPPVEIEVESRRHRRVPPLTFGNMLIARREPGDDAVSDAADLIAILADALEKIVETTTDPDARSVAATAMVEFYGR